MNLYSPGFIDETKKPDYYVFQDNILDMVKVDKEDILGVKDDLNGLYENLSIPFKFTNSKISSVFISYDDKKSIIDEFLDSLKQKEYYNVDEHILNSSINFEYKSGSIIKLILINSKNQILLIMEI